MNNLIARKFPPASRDNEQGCLDWTMPSTLVAVRRLDHGSLREWPLLTADPTTLDSLVEMKCDQRSGPETLANDPSLVAPVIASPEEVFRARELREQIKKEYLNRPSQPRSLWCLGID